MPYRCGGVCSDNHNNDTDMNLSSVDLGNPIYARSTPSVKYMKDEMTDYILDEQEESYVVKIDYEYYEYDHAVRLVSLTVTTKCPTKYLQEDVLEMIRQRERQKIELECSMELTAKQP